MHVLLLCIRLNSFVARMVYTLSFSHNIEVPIAKNKNKYFISLNTKTTVFAWGDVN